jgi:hypothetical protein
VNIGGGTFTNNLENATHIVSTSPLKHPTAEIVDIQWLKKCVCELKVVDPAKFKTFLNS